MAACKDMRVGETYTCTKCNIEVRVTRACEGPECGVGEHEDCGLECCGEPLTKREKE